MSFAAVVTDIRLLSQSGVAARWQMSLDRTDFLPGMTGRLEAETRTGTRLSIPVTRVLCDESGVVWHEVEKPLAAGTDVLGTVDGTGFATTKPEFAPQVVENRDEHC